MPGRSHGGHPGAHPGGTPVSWHPQQPHQLAPLPALLGQGPGHHAGRLQLHHVRGGRGQRGVPGGPAQRVVQRAVHGPGDQAAVPQAGGVPHGRRVAAFLLSPAGRV